MGKTYKYNSYKSKTRISFRIKQEAKRKRKSLKFETNPRALKLSSANEWYYN